MAAVPSARPAFRGHGLVGEKLSTFAGLREELRGGQRTEALGLLAETLSSEFRASLPALPLMVPTRRCVCRRPLGLKYTVSSVAHIFS